MKSWRCLAWVGIVVVWLASPAWAGGLWLYENGTPDLGTAGAGRAAMALDASTAFGNPAGMTKLERSQFLGSFQLILPSIHFNVERGPPSAAREKPAMPAFPCPAPQASMSTKYLPTGVSA